MAIEPRHAVIARNYGGKLKLPRSSGGPLSGLATVCSRYNVLFIRNGRRIEGSRLIGSVSLCHRNRNAAGIFLPAFLSRYLFTVGKYLDTISQMCI